MTNTFTPSRLSLARRRRGKTKTELSRSTGISSRSLTAYESGTQVPTPANLARLSFALQFPVGFFSGAELDEPPLGGTSYRSLTRMSARQQGQAEASATFALALSDWIEANFKIPSADGFPRFQGLDPESAAAAVRAEWNLGEKPIKNIVHLLESRGVRVYSLAEECAEVDAFSFWRQGETPFVFLNTMKTAEHGRMDAAHELGHLVLHWGHDTPTGRTAEHEARLFGAAFLMPRDSVLAEAPAGGNIAQLIAAKRRWRVSVAALAYRMHQVGMLSDWQHRAMFMEIGRRGYRTDEPNAIARETSQVLAKVFASLRESGRSLPDLARELELPAEELNKSVFGLVLTGLQGTGVDSGPATERAGLRVVASPDST